MNARQPARAAVVVFLLALALPALVAAAWPTDPETDLFVGDGPGECHERHGERIDLKAFREEATYAEYRRKPAD